MVSVHVESTQNQHRNRTLLLGCTLLGSPRKAPEECRKVSQCFAHPPLPRTPYLPLRNRYGAVPVVRRTGGLNDTVRDIDCPGDSGLPGNGFVFEGMD